MLSERLSSLRLYSDGGVAIQQRSGEPCGGCGVRQQVVEIDREAADYRLPPSYTEEGRVHPGRRGRRPRRRQGTESDGLEIALRRRLGGWHSILVTGRNPATPLGSRAVTPQRLSAESAPIVRWVGAVSAFVVATAAVVVVLGWLLDVMTMRELIPGFVPMKFNTAVCFAALAYAILRKGRRRSATAAAWFVLIVASLTLVEYVWDASLGIDELLVDDRDFALVRNPPGRMAVVTAIALVALSCSVLSLGRKSGRVAELLLTVPLTIGAFTLLGYLYGAERLYEVVSYSTVSMPTAAAFVLLVFAIAALVPNGALQWVLSDAGAGGTLMRALAPIALALIPLLGYVRLQGQANGLYGTRYGLALMVAMSAAAVLGAAWIAAHRLDRSDAARDLAEVELRGLNASLVDGRDQAWRQVEALAAELSAEHARFERATAKSNDVIWTVELVAHGAPKLEFATGDARGVFGRDLRPGESIEELLDKLAHRDDTPAIRDFHEQITHQNEAEAEVRLVGFDGETRHVWVRGGARREGERRFIDCIATNVTERRMVADQLERVLELEQEQVQRLTEVNRLRDQFIARAGHELRTPLTVIAGFAEVLARDEELNSSQQKQAATIARRAFQTRAMLGEMFDLAKINAGMSELALESVAIDELLRQSVQEHQVIASASGVTITSQFQPAQVLADPSRLRQVMDNLLSNAVKYTTPTRGAVRVECQASEKQVRVTVHDTGIGIPTDELTHVFEPLYRASTAQATNINGTGLGLSITKTLVEAHGGTITVESSAATGTTFTVRLPPLSQPRGATPEPDRSQSPRRTVDLPSMSD